MKKNTLFHANDLTLISITDILKKNVEGEQNMKCPYCNNPDTKVIDSRPADDGSSIRRRRACDECGKRFTTYEKVETIPLIVIKKDDNREQYDRRKIESGVLSACYKRPVSARERDSEQGDWRNRDGQAERVRCSCLCKICFCVS